MPCPDYVGPLSVRGSVGPIFTTDATQSFGYSLDGIDPSCSTLNPSVPNSCGISIHQGTSCTSDTGGHNFNPWLVPSDPWTSIAYTVSFASGVGRAVGSASVGTGRTSLDMSGKAIVVYDRTGIRIACAILSEVPPPFSWCNVFLCHFDMSCAATRMCQVFSRGMACEPWCNALTCALQHCGGCGDELCPSIGSNRPLCASWCSEWSCEHRLCVGCNNCAAARAVPAWAV